MKDAKMPRRGSTLPGSGRAGLKCETLRPLTHHLETSVSSLVIGKKWALERVPAYFNNNHQLHFTAHLLAALTAGHL